jgi:hypothetical protein
MTIIIAELMPKVDSITKMILRDPTNAIDVLLCTSRQASTNFGAEAQEVLVMLRIGRKSRTLSNHEHDKAILPVLGMR